MGTSLFGDCLKSTYPLESEVQIVVERVFPSAYFSCFINGKKYSGYTENDPYCEKKPGDKISTVISHHCNEQSAKLAPSGTYHLFRSIGPEARAQIKKALNSRNWNRRQWGLKRAVELGSNAKPLLPRIRQIYNGDPKPSLRKLAAAAILSVGPSADKDPIKKLLEEGIAVDLSPFGESQLIEGYRRQLGTIRKIATDFTVSANRNNTSAIRLKKILSGSP